MSAAADGTVIIARNNGAWNGGYGNYVVITHNNGTQTLYSHMKNTIVSSGQSVLSGQIIGYVGSTGLSTGAHLHFEVRGAAILSVIAQSAPPTLRNRFSPGLYYSLFLL